MPFKRQFTISWPADSSSWETKVAWFAENSGIYQSHFVCVCMVLWFCLSLPGARCTCTQTTFDTTQMNWRALERHLVFPFGVLRVVCVWNCKDFENLWSLSRINLILANNSQFTLLSFLESSRMFMCVWCARVAVWRWRLADEPRHSSSLLVLSILRVALCKCFYKKFCALLRLPLRLNPFRTDRSYYGFPPRFFSSPLQQCLRRLRAPTVGSYNM